MPHHRKKVKRFSIPEYLYIIHNIMIRHLHFTEYVSIADENSHLFLTDSESKLVATYTNFPCVTNFPSLIHIFFPCSVASGHMV